MKRGHHHGALRQALIDASLELLDAQGAEGVTIRASARKAGVSHAAPANHFSDRRALLTAVAAQCFAGLVAAARATRDEAGSAARERLFGFVDGYVRWALAHPDRYRLMWRMDLLDAREPELLALVDGLYEEVAQMVLALKTRATDGATRVIAISSLVHGYALMRIDGNFIAADDESSGRPRHEAIVAALLGV